MIPIILAVLVGLVHLAIVVTILVYERRQPSAMLAWLLALALLPILGALAYLFFGRARASRLSKAYTATSATVSKMLEAHTSGKESLRALERGPDAARTTSTLRLAERLASTRATVGNQVDLLIDGAQTYSAMLDAFQNAQSHIHVEFYIIQPDEVGRRLREELTKRAKDGIEVRVLCDGVGSAGLPRGFWTMLREAGGEVAVFRPVSSILARMPWRERIDFRDHRKNVIVDGRVGFTGGINAGREYLGLNPEHGHWRDTHLRIQGPAVLALQKAFAEGWLHASGKSIAEERYFEEPQTMDENSVVQIIDSTPAQMHSPVSYLFAMVFHQARERIWLSSPYFIPEPAIEDALKSAALRGVDVRLLVPLKSDMRLVGYAGESYYPALLDAGVRVFRYEEGFMHAKTMVIDNWVTVVGSANMDIRSFHLNYELSALILGEAFAQKLADQFTKDFADSLEMDPEEDPTFVRRLLQSGARLFSPLL